MSYLNKKLSILVNTCDKYFDAIPAFFKLWFKYCNGLDCNIYLNSEENEFIFDGHSIKVFHSEKTIPWCARVKKCLDNINTDYVLSFHEDYFLNDYIDVEKLEKYVRLLDNDKMITSIALRYLPLFLDEKRYEYGENFEDLEVRSPFSFYQLVSSGIYRTDRFNYFIRKTENPWQMESYGNMRAWLFPQYKYLVPKKNSTSPVKFIYSAIWKGKWVPCLVDELFKLNNINYSNLGYYENSNDIDFLDIAEKSAKTHGFLVSWFIRLKMIIGHFDYFFHK